jgi:hypothetical protein
LFTTDTFDLYIGNGTTNTRFQKYIASGATTQILRGDGSLYTFPLAISSPSNGQVLKYNGTSWVNDSDSGITGSGTTNEIAYFTGATTLGSLTTATYPSLTELSYVKGVTSAIQTQINAKFTLPSLTSGSVLFSNGTTIAQDNANLFWDNTNDRLGIGTVTPQSKLQVRNGDFGIYNGTTGSLGGQIYLGDINFDNSSYWNSAPGIGAVYSASSGVASDLGFYTYAGSANARTERIRIFYTGNVAVGGTFSSDSGEKLQVTGTAKITGAATFGSTISTNGGYFALRSSAASALGYFLQTKDWIGGGSTDANPALATESSYGLNFYTNGSTTLKMRLDTSGNLGLGVTPSAWNTSYKALDIGNVFGLMGASNAADLYGNLFFNASSQFIYKTTAAATAYSLASGQHRWYVVASGTAGNVATLTANMTLTNAGRLLLNQTSDTGEQLQVNGTAKITGAVTGASFIPSVGSAVTNGMYLNNTNSLAFSTNSTFRLVIGSTGIVGIGIPNPSLGYGDGIGVELSPVGYIQSYRSQAVSATFGRHTSTGLIQTFFYGATAGTAAQIGAIGTDGDGLTFSGGAFGTTHLTLTSGGNFAVDTNTLFVDATANEVGIGTSSPNSVLHVVGSVSKSISDVKTANYTATATDHTILCSAASGAITITLPAASGIAGRIYVIKKTNASSGVNSVTVDGNGSETIDGSASINLSCKSSVMLQCDGSNWHILSLYTDTSCL